MYNLRYLIKEKEKEEKEKRPDIRRLNLDTGNKSYLSVKME